MQNEKSAAIVTSNRNLLLTVLLLTTFLASTIMVFYSTLLVEIADSFNVSIGLASQLSLIGSATGLITGFVMGALTAKFTSKSLFLAGTGCFSCGALTFYLAPNFTVLLISEFFVGVGVAVIGILTYTLIGDNFPLEKRGKAIGLTFSVPAASFILVGPLSGVISAAAGWRSVLLLLILPLAAVCLLLSYFVISNQPKRTAQEASLSKPFKKVLLHKSAMACILSTVLITFISVVPLFAVSFYRLNFGVSATLGASLSSVSALGAMIGGVVAGKLINTLGRKKTTVVAGAFSGFSVILFSSIAVLWVSWFFWVLAAFTGAITATALYSLILEQLPAFRAELMSINQAFHNGGVIIGVALGGLVLTLQTNNFQLLMLLYGVLGALAAPLVLFLANDVTRKDPA